MKYYFHILIMGIVLLILTGCSQKYISVKTVVPAQFDRALHYKHLSILPTQNDTFQTAHFLEEKLLEKYFNGTQLFQLVSSRNALPLSTKQPHVSSEIDAYVAMHIDIPVIYDTPYYVERIRCSDSKCKYSYTVYVPCVERSYSTSISFQMIDAKNSNLILSKNFSKSSQDRACHSSGYNQLPNIELHLKIMQQQIVNEFIAHISPTYYAINARLAFKEPKIELTNESEKNLEAGIEALKNNNTSLAKGYFEKVLSMTNNQSYVATHNLGLVYEAKGDFNSANAFYQKCATLVQNISEHLELELSLSRIKRSLENEKIAMKQI